MKAFTKFLGIIVIGAVITIGLIGCKDDDGGNSGAGSVDPLEGTWSEQNNRGIRFSGGNLQSTVNITVANPNWTLEGTYTYNDPTLTVNPPPQNGVVQNAKQMTAVINGIRLTITGSPDAWLNTNWTKQ